MTYINAAMFRAIGFVSRVDALKFIKAKGIRKITNEDTEKYLQRVKRVRIDDKKKKSEIKMTMMNLQNFLSQNFTTYIVHREINEIQQSEQLTIYFDDLGDLYDDVEVKTKKYEIYDNQIKKIYKFTDYEINYDYPFGITYKKIKRDEFNSYKKIKLNFIDLMDRYIIKTHKKEIINGCKSINYIRYSSNYIDKINIQRIIEYGTNFYNHGLKEYSFYITSEGEILDMYNCGKKIEDFYNQKEYLQQIYNLCKHKEINKMQKILLGQEILEFKKYWSINDVYNHNHTLEYFNYKLIEDHPLNLTPLNKYVNEKEEAMYMKLNYYFVKTFNDNKQNIIENFTLDSTDFLKKENKLYNLMDEKQFMKNYIILKKRVGFNGELYNETKINRNKFDKILKFNPIQIMALIGGPFNNDLIGEIAKFLLVV